jgi:hypothetical protein
MDGKPGLRTCGRQVVSSPSASLCGLPAAAVRMSSVEVGGDERECLRRIRRVAKTIEVELFRADGSCFERGRGVGLGGKESAVSET